MSHDETEQYIRLISKGSTPVAMTTRELERASTEDSVREHVKKCLITRNWDKLTSK